MTPKNTKNLGLWVLIAETIINIGMAAGSYASYLMTDIVNLDLTVASGIMTVGSVIAIVCNILGGAFITNTRSRMGRFRPWLIGLYVVIPVSLFMMMFHYGSSTLTVVIIAVAYAAYTVALNLGATPKYGLYAQMSGEDSDLRNDLNGKSWAGVNLSVMFSSFALLPMVYAIAGSGSEATGWRVTQIILSALTIVGIVILCKISKPYDPDNRSSAKGNGAENVKFSSMLKATLVNRSALVTTIGDIARYAGFTLLYSIMYYQVISVLGNYMLMTIVSVTSCIVTVLGGMVAPYVVKALGGRKKTAIIASFVTALLFASFCLVGQTSWGFLVTLTLANLTASFVDTVDPLLYVDAGEYWLDKHGEDTRPFLMSVQPIASSVGSTVAASLFAVAMLSCNYVPDTILTGADAAVLTNWVGLAPAIGFVVYGLLLLTLHNVSDKEMVACIQRNADAGLGMGEE